MPSSAGLRPKISYFTLKDHTYRVLKDLILNMNIYDPKVDLRLDERELAEKLGISRTPLREALARLAQDGLIEIFPRKGIVVHRKSKRVILEMIVTWTGLESMAARLASQKAKDADLAHLREEVGDTGLMSVNGLIGGFSEENFQFHNRVLELSGTPLLVSTTQTLFDHLRPVRRRGLEISGPRGAAVTGHLDIVSALIQRDGDLAAARTRRNIMILHDHIRKNWIELG